MAEISKLKMFLTFTHKCPLTFTESAFYKLEPVYKVKRQKKTKRTIYNFHNANFYGMRQSLRFIDWDNVLLDNEDVNESCEKWQQVLHQLLINM